MFKFLLFFLLKKIISQIFLPLKLNKTSFNNDFIYNFLNQEFYTEINLGTPKQKIFSYILFNDSGFYIKKSSFYNHKKSSSFKSLNNFKEERFFNSKYFEWALNSTETFYFSSKKKIKNLNFLYLINEQKKEKYFNENCNSILGFKPGKNSFIEILKEKKIIEKKCATFDLKNNVLIIGNFPYEIYDFYNKNEFLISNLEIHNFNFEWQIKIDKIFSEKLIEFDKICKFNINVEGLIGTKNIQEFVNKTFFNVLIEEKKCFHERKEKFGFYYCKNDVNLNDFKTIFFNQKSFNFTFEFNFKDLFKKIENYYFFLIIFNEKIEFGHEIIFGRIFFEKYLLTFEQERKIIAISLKNTKKKNKFNIKLLIIIFLLLIILLLLTTILKLNFLSRKKKHSNIIDYEYFPKLIE